MTPSPHPLDHLVLPTFNISAARERLAKLGFTVAADARHPFGTENACVFLADKTYLEPLAVANREECEEAARTGNVFVARDQAFRYRVGEDGFSAVVFATGDAAADNERFKANAISAGPTLEFSRPMRMPDGRESVAGFRLAFAADLRAPDFLTFCCERINPLPADRDALERHDNGVLGLMEVVLSAPDPEAYVGLIEQAGNNPALSRQSFGVTAQTPNGRLVVMTPKGLEAFYDLAIPADERGLRARAILFRSRDLSVTSAHLAANGIAYTHRNNRILVKVAPGQGALFAFEEQK